MKEGSDEDKKFAKRILPLLHNHNLLLATLVRLWRAMRLDSSVIRETG
jgi:hypothetical protein